MKLLYGLLAYFMLWQASSFAQTKILEKYNFEEGGYYLVGLQTMEGGKNAFADSTKEFYIDDLKTLQAIQKEWIFTKPSPQYACGYHYEVFVCKNGVGLESFNINLNCNLIDNGDLYFYFNPKKLTKYHKKFKKIAKKQVINLDSLTTEKAKAYKNTISENPKILLVEATIPWEQYEGYFTFQCKKGFYQEAKERLTELRKEIEKNYPDDIFDLNITELSRYEVEVSIKCNKSLAKKFNLYETIGKWEDHEKYIICYWAK